MRFIDFVWILIAIGGVAFVLMPVFIFASIFWRRVVRNEPPDPRRDYPLGDLIDPSEGAGGARRPW